MTKLPNFEGRPLMEIPKAIPSANVLGGDFGKAVLQEYKQAAETTYKGADALDVLSYHNNLIEGSNPFAVVLVNQIVGQDGLRTATPADLERAIRLNKVNQQLGLNLRGTYEDTGLVLRSESEPNEYLAKDVAKQIKARNVKLPVMIPLNGLELVNDSKSEHDLSFKLKEDAQVIHAPILNKDGGYFTSEMIDEQTGLPKQVGENGDRYLYTRNSGLSGLYLNRVLILYSSWDDLAYSDSDGRVAVVGDGAVNPEKYVAEINKANAEETTRLQKILENTRMQHQKITDEAVAQVRKQ